MFVWGQEAGSTPVVREVMCDTDDKPWEDLGKNIPGRRNTRPEALRWW